MKIDIRKAFDTWEWRFLLKVLQTFGFNQKFCSWINAILLSARLSISINGKASGYFGCKRGVRQGDPISPMLFCLAEEVLSRAVSKLVNDGRLSLMTGPRGVSVLSHVMYADNVMIFCRGSKRNLKTLLSLFHKYGAISGQIINHAKSTFYAGPISARRRNYIAALLGFSFGHIPFTYLGIPIFQGKPKRMYLEPIADRIRCKLSAWKASLLSIAGRVLLVKSVIYDMLLYSFLVYVWPIGLLKTVEKWIINFIWSGDVNQKKVVTMAWHKVCSPTLEGGLGIRSLKEVNKAAILRLCWELMSSQNQWADLLTARVFKNDSQISYHICSSIWSGLKDKVSTVLDNMIWQVGSGSSIRFWLDNWSSEPIVSLFNIPENIHPFSKAKVKDFLSNGSRIIPSFLIQQYPALLPIMQQTVIPTSDCSDSMLWKKTDSGELSFKDAYLFYKPIGQSLSWCKLI